MLESLRHFFSSEHFMPHGHCYLWKPSLLWLQVVSNALIGIAYVAISTTLVVLVRKLKGIPFQWMYVAFGLFIVACGVTHFMHIWTIWQPVYWTDGFIRAFTALVSIVTAVLLPFLVPKAAALSMGVKFALDRGIKLESAYQELEQVFGKTKELDELKTQFFANVSHELRTPLTLVLGPAEKLAYAPNLTPDQRHDVDLITRNGRLLLKHVNDLLDVAKLEAGRLEPKYRVTDLVRLARLTAANFDGIAADRQMKLQLVTPESLQVEVDPDMIQRILMNLLSNAFKFSPNEKPISVIVRDEGDRVAFQVRDAGPGIPKEARETIFERFRQLDGGSTRQFGGTGLGLSIAREFAELHRGQIEVDEAPGSGAIFTVRIPKRAPEGATVLAGEETETAALRAAVRDLEVARKRVEDSVTDPNEENRGKILVVEDNPDMNRFIAETLRRDYLVVTASDGQEALDEIGMHEPDLILTDIMMPRLSGEQLVHEVRKRTQYHSVPIILLTAKADDDLRVKLLREGAQDYVTKPFSREELLARVRNLITVRRATVALQKELASQLVDIESLANEVTLRRKELFETMDALREAKTEAERASQVKTNFLGLLSHEVKTPIAALQLNIALLKRSGALTPEQIELIDRIHDSSERSLSLMRSLLEYTRLQSGKLEKRIENVDLPKLIEGIARSQKPAAEAKSLNYAVEIPSLAGAPALRSDPLLIELVVKNMIANAVKYTNQGGIRVALDYAFDAYRVSVTDTGPGIAPENLSRIFDPFVQLTALKKHSSGVGLGLAIAKEVTETLGGTIEVNSELGRGSSFTAIFPAAPSP